MPSILMPLGVLILTYWVSRACLRALRPAGLDRVLHLLVAHAISLVLLSIFVFVVEANNINAPLSYIPGQLAWLALDWFRTQDAGGQRRRRRRSSSMASGTYRPGRSFTGYAKLIPWAMALLTLGYGVYGWRIFRYEAVSYHDVIVGTSPQDTIYAAGKPVYGRNADSEKWQKIDDPLRYSQWLYQQPLMTVRFTPEHRVAEISCRNDDKLSQSACWPTLAVGVGSSEGLLYEKLGMAPAGGTTVDGKRIARYPELGHDFVLEQFYVRALRVGPSDGSFFAKWWRFFLWLVP